MPVVKYTLDGKQPSEIIEYQIDFTELMGSTTTIVSYVVQVFEVSAGTDVTTTMLSTYFESSGVISALIQAGTDGTQYDIHVEATMNDGQMREVDAMLTVNEIGQP